MTLKPNYNEHRGGYYHGGDRRRMGGGGAGVRNWRSGEMVIDDRVYVGDLPAGMNDKDLFDMFSKFGKVENAVTLMKPRQEDNHNTEYRFGFITFSACSSSAVHKLLNDTPADQLTWRGHKLTVGQARQRQRYGGYNSQYDRQRRLGQSQTWHRRGDKPEEKTEVAKENIIDVGEEEAMVQFEPQPVPGPMMMQCPMPGQVDMGQMTAQYGMVPVPQMEYPGMVPYQPYPSVPVASYPGYYDYGYYPDQMMMYQQQTMYSQNMFWQGMPVMYPQPQFIQQYPQMELSQMQPPDMSDSGYHDMSSSVSMVYPGDMTQIQEPVQQQHQEQEHEASPILNMSQVIHQQEETVALASTDKFTAVRPETTKTKIETSHGGHNRVRCYNTPNKQFTNFRGGNHLDPNHGNRYPFTRDQRNFHPRRYSASDKHSRHEIIKEPTVIKKPFNDEITKKREDKRIINQPDLLQDSLHHKLIK